MQITIARAQLLAALCRENVGHGLQMQRHDRGLSLLGLKRNCLTLSVAQWRKIIAAAPQIEAYIRKHGL